MGWREVKRRTPGGRTTILLKREKSSPHKCAKCGKPLQGIPREHPSVFRRLNKTQKRISRKFGGYLCHECAKREIISKVREEFKI